MYFEPPQKKSLGVSLDDIIGAVKNVTNSKVVGTVTNIMEDPALPEFTGLVVELHKIEQQQNYFLALTKGSKPKPPVKGIGLNKIVPPLKVYVAMRKQPVIGLAALAGIIAIPVMLGYAIGKKRRK